MACREKCPPTLIEDFAKLNLPGPQLWNADGPSEATMGTTDVVLSPGKPAPDHVLVGSAMTDLSVHVRDDNLKPVPTGAIGQIYIVGAEVTIGYLGRDEPTAEKRIVKPCASAHFKANGWTRMYTTGDKGRMMPGRSLRILGQYMHPAAISPVQTLPLTANGRIDSRAIQKMHEPLPWPTIRFRRRIRLRGCRAIIHSGTEVSFLKTYPTLKRANVDATQYLAALAFRYNLAPAPDFPDAYVASKWAREWFLENAHARLGLPLWLHRPSSITGSGANELDVMNSMGLFARRLQAVPQLSRWRVKLDSISMEGTTRTVVAEVVAGSFGQHITFIHRSGETFIPIDQLSGYLENTDGVEHGGLPLAEWTEKAVAEGLSVLIAACLSAVDELDMGIVFQDLVRGRM
ncbi:hypothetical protein DL765_009592 [Monosporascus sp. GIB2]|nr:hypothetical protein DL765_009592 [Monosporascus sp. GIB2]